MKKDLAALIIEDSADDALLLIRHLKKSGYEIVFERVDTKSDLAAALSRRVWDVILSDYLMPGFKGTEALQFLREMGSEIPFIFVSGSMGEDIAVLAMKAGARDYVMKGNLGRLVPAIERELVETENRVKKNKAEKELLMFRKAADTSGEIIFTTDRNGIFTYVNSEFSKVYGYTPDEVIGKCTPRILKSGILDSTQYETLWQTLLGGKVYRREMANKTKTGTAVPIETTVNCVYDEGSIVGFLAIQRDITERVKAHAEIEWLSRFPRENPSPVLRISSEGKVLFANEASKPLLIAPRTRVGEKVPLEILDVVDQTFKQKKILEKELVAHGRIYSCVFTPVSGSGYVNVYCTDSTDRKRAETSLKESEERYRLLFDNSIDAVLLTSPDGSILEANGAACRMFGRTEEELQRLSLSGIVDASDPRLAHALEERARTSQFSGELTFLKPDGTKFPAEITTSVFEDHEGRERTSMIIRDVTERKQMVESLRESEERLSLAVSASGLGLWDWDIVSDMAYLSPQYYELTGYKPGEIHPNSAFFESIIHPEDSWAVLKTMGEHLRGQRELSVVEYRMKRKSGEYKWIHGVGKVIARGEKGSPMRMIGIISDITDRRMLEQQMIQAQKMESIGTLAGGIAHDFNNILGIILGHASLMNRLMEDPSKLSQSIDAIQKATNRGAALVRQLLTFARKNETKFQSVHMNDILREIIGLIGETFPKLITVSTNLQNDLPSISADPTQIHQVLLNLCVNARDAMPDGGSLSISTSIVSGSLVTRLFPEAGAGEYLAIEVADTGTGMDDATRGRIFEPFFTTKELGKGTGLGLSLVHSIVANHIGFIDVQSTKGVGTTFRLFFPTERQIPAIEQRTQQSLEDIPGGTETILVIDDEEFLRELLTAALAAKGYTVLTAEDGMAGVALFERHRDRVAVIISDLGLPRLRGDAVLKLVRSIKSDAKFILASGYLEPKIKAEMENNGCRHFLQKPYAAEELLGVVRKVIDGEFT